MSDDELLDVARTFADRGYDDVPAIAALATALAASGTVERLAVRGADVASTGGPSSLTTLICPLYLVVAGWDVPKLTVPGRPAGGIDVLGTIAGYRTEPDREEALRALRTAHYVHMLSSGNWAPLDLRLFRVRQKNGLQNVAPLVVASILSKKLALGIERAAVEIRRGAFGNLGDEQSVLEGAATLFATVADALGFRCQAVITGDGGPYQPFIGRGEALLGLQEVFDGPQSTLLAAHGALCRQLAEAAIGASIVDANGETLRSIFEANLLAQGSSYEAFLVKAEHVRSERRTLITARRAGFLSWGLGELREAITQFQGSREQDGAFPDRCGVILLRSGGLVRAADEIATVRGPAEAAALVGHTYTIREGVS